MAALSSLAGRAGASDGSSWSSRLATAVTTELGDYLDGLHRGTAGQDSAVHARTAVFIAGELALSSTGGSVSLRLVTLVQALTSEGSLEGTATGPLVPAAIQVEFIVKCP